MAVAFAGALTENEKLHVLDLSYNQLGEMGGLYLGAGLVRTLLIFIERVYKRAAFIRGNTVQALKRFLVIC